MLGSLQEFFIGKTGFLLAYLIGRGDWANCGGGNDLFEVLVLEFNGSELEG